MSVTLNVRDVARRALEAYEAGNLQCQHPDLNFEGSGCWYRPDPENHPNVGCALGVCVPLETAIEWDQGQQSLETMIDLGIIATDEKWTLIKLQRFHDSCCTSPHLIPEFVQLLKKEAAR